MDTPADYIEMTQQGLHLRRQFFFDQVLGSYQWWLLVCMVILPWALWLILVDRRRMKGILLTGFYSAMFTMMLDQVGAALSFWVYPYQLIYFTPGLIPIDFSVVPVSFMILYQYLRSWKSYIFVIILLAIIAMFIEALYDKINIAVVIHWKYVYSPPFYVAIGIAFKWVADHLTESKGFHHL